jgi:predicted metal-dependent phosphoesterase TrpH
VPRASAYTSVARRLADLARPRRADLHVHTTASDGEFTPSQVAALARAANLAAVAVTDHDTLAAVDEARAAAGGHVEVISGVEVSAAFAGREVHLLGYFVRTDHPGLIAALRTACDIRRERFRDYVAALAARGLALPGDRVRLTEDVSPSLGRRHVAKLLVACGFARHWAEAFHRHLGPLAGVVRPKALLPVDEAIRLVRDAGGVSSLAHPPRDLTDADFHTLAGFGLDAVEAEYPWGRESPAARLRDVARRLGLGVTGGSDCHGPDPARRRVGSHGVGAGELADLRGRRDRPG